LPNPLDDDEETEGVRQLVAAKTEGEQRPDFTASGATSPSASVSSFVPPTAPGSGQAPPAPTSFFEKHKAALIAGARIGPDGWDRACEGVRDDWARFNKFEQEQLRILKAELAAQVAIEAEHGEGE
jgi:hypothetical protein